MNGAFKSAQAFSGRAATVLTARLQRHQRLLSAVRAVLPHDLAESISACVATDDKLLLYSNSAAWSSQLRFYSDTLLAAANASDGGNFKTVTARVAIQHADYPDPRRTARIPGQVQIDELYGVAADSAGDPLGKALAKLAATLRRLQDEAAGRGA